MFYHSILYIWRKDVSKYASLRDHLIARKNSPWMATFSEIEHVLGFSLPSSARKYPAWWANQSRGSHVQCSGWLGAGWHTSNVDLGSERVTFERVGEAHREVSVSNFKPTRASLNWEDVLAPEGAELPISLGVGFNWHNLGALYIDHKNRIVFPRVP